MGRSTMASMSFLNSLRQCRAALRRSDALQQSSKPMLRSSVRSVHGPLPTFEASTEELAAHLHKIRKTIIIPAHLKESQRKLVYKTKNHQALANEPLFVDLGKESVQIEPIDRTHDVPNTWTAVVQALNLMSKSDNQADWKNLHKLLQGMRDAGRKFHVWQWEAIIRMAGENNACRQLVVCVSKAQQTGLFLADTRIVRELIWAIRNMAVSAEWQGDQLKQACRYAEQVATMMDGPRHREAFRKMRRDRTQKSDSDPLIQPDITAVLLELWTVLAREAGGSSSDEEGAEMAKEKSKEYLAKLLSMLSASNPAETGNTFTKGQEAREADYEISRLVPIYHGLRETLLLHKSGLQGAEEVTSRFEQVKIKLEALRDVVRNSDEGEKALRSKRRGFLSLEKVGI